MESKTGSILCLIGGILWLVVSIMLIIGSLIIVILTALNNVIEGLIFGVIFLVIGIIFVIYGTLGIKASQWMKNKEEVKKGGIVALIVGILGVNALLIIGGILGLVDADK